MIRRPFAPGIRVGAGALVIASGLAGAPTLAAQETREANEAQDANEAQERPRNVVLILSDDLRYDFMGFMESAPEWLETPGFDRMRREGAHIANAFVTTSLCSPSRASILTGLYAHRHGVVDNQSELRPGTLLFPELLDEAGWATAFIGKWHMGHHSDQPQPGFDRWVSFPGQGVYYDPTFNVDGDTVPRQGYITDILTEYALDWLGERAAGDSDEPFFLYLSHKAVHAEFEPAERHAGRYADAPIPYPASMDNTVSNYRGKPRWVREQRYGWHGVAYAYHGDLDFDEFYRLYAETLLALDESVGRVLDYLEESGLAESTLVLFMSDNGFMLGEHGLIDKRQAYEESIRIPMLAWAPGVIEPGSTVEELVRNIDIAPTILDIAGIEVAPFPADTGPEAAGKAEGAADAEAEADAEGADETDAIYMDGRSVLPLLRGEDLPGTGEFLYEYYWEYAFPHTPTVFALRGDRYKFIFYHGVWDTNEFFDLLTDPNEMHNLIHVPAYQDEVEAFQTRLWERLAQTDGMRIPLKPMVGWQANERLIHVE